MQRYPNNKHRRVSYRIQNFLLEPLRDERGRGKEINKEYNFVRVIHRSNTSCANTYNPIDRSIDMSSSTDRKHRNGEKTRRARNLEFLTRVTRTESRALRALTCIHVQRLAAEQERSRRSRSTPPVLRRATGRDGGYF